MKQATILLLILAHTLFCNAGTAPVKKKELPNIVLIVADDLGYGDLGCYGQKKISTPNIDRLASEGMLFTQYYAGTAVCAPSRSAMLTGQDTGHTPIRGNKSVEPEGQWPLPASSSTIAELLKRAGYTTGAFGKWGLGYIGTEGDPNNQGFDRFYGYNCQSLAHNYYPDHLWDNKRRIELSGNSGAKAVDYAPDLIHKQALEFMEDNKDKPFFLFYPTTLPHAELLVPEKEMAAYRGKLNPEKTYEGARPGDARYRLGPYSYQAEPHAAFAAMITILDQKVGELMKKLDDLHIADNTIVLLTSDNGPHLEGGADPDYFDSNGPFRGYKRDLYEGGIRVPLIVRWKNKIAPRMSSNEVVAAWDILPTCASLAGVQAPREIQGRSILPILTGIGKLPAHGYLYWEFHEGGGTKAVRQGRWKLICRNVLDPTRTSYELYDIETDESEQHDVSEAHAKEVGELKILMTKARIPAADFPFE